MEGLLYLQEIVLLGTARHIFEFVYMFSGYKISGYATEEEMLYPIELKKLSMSELEERVNAGALLVVCDLDTKPYIMLPFEKWREGEQYILFEQLFPLLDTFCPEILGNKKLALWGTGNTAKHLLEDCAENGYNLDFELYVDSDEKKRGTFLGEKQIVSFEDIKEPGEFFYIVASFFYYDIKACLEAAGLEEGRDFLGFSAFITRPSKMMSEQIRAMQKKDFFCDQPFKWFSYVWCGVYPCCSTWIKYPIGHPACDTPEKAWNSCEARLYRLSMLTKTFCFCKMEACGSLGNKQETDMKCYNEENIPKHITLGLDYTCNLYCSSCRDSVQVCHGGQLEVREKMADRLLDTGWLDKCELLELSGTGEALFSKIDRRLLFDENGITRDRISLLTNGVLLNQENWDKLRQKYKHIRVQISIDAASEETYKKIRRGGDWEKLQRNLKMLSELRKGNQIEYIDIRMVVQRNNYLEIPQFVQMGKSLGFDGVFFKKMLNLGTYSEEEYPYESMTDSKGKLVKELRQVLEHPILNESIVHMPELKKIM